MARIQHWIQNNSIDFFITNNDRQNLLAPFGEYLILHFQILSKSDLFVNLIQWFSFIINILTITLITKEFDLKKEFQLKAGFLVCCIPTAILQASSTKNDIILCSFILLFYYYQIRLAKSQNFKYLILSGLALGLGGLTKTTAFLFLFPIGFTFFLFSFIKSPQYLRSKIFFQAILVIIIGFTVNLPHFLRTKLAFGNFLGMHGEVQSQVLNNQFSLFTIFSNFIRHVAYQLGSNIDLANWYIYRLVQIPLGQHLSDPDTTYLGWTFRPPRKIIHEDHAGNPMHILLILLVLIIGAFFFKKIKKFNLTTFFISSGSIILYCMLLKWQPWTNKNLPMIIITIPFVMIVLEKLYENKKLKFLFDVFLILTFFYTLPFLFYNKARPILPINKNSIFKIDRKEAYFSNRPELYEQYQSITSNIEFNKNDSNSKRVVALFLDYNSWEYPFWVLIKNKNIESQPTIYHLNKGIAFDTKIDLPTYIILENIISKELSGLNEYYVEVIKEQDFSLYTLI